MTLAEDRPPMDREAIRRLLAVVMLYDNRSPGNGTIAAWQKAAGLARWTEDEAVDAVHAHYARSTDYLMPGHITAHIRAQREHRQAQWLRARPQRVASDEVREGAMAAIRRTFADVRRRRQEATAPTPEEDTHV